jgi:hypothetical protein
MALRLAAEFAHVVSQLGTDSSAGGPGLEVIPAADGGAAQAALGSDGIWRKYVV